LPVCKHEKHAKIGRLVAPRSIDRAAQLFRAMGDGPRLRILELLQHGELCVSEIVSAANEKFSTVSQRLRILRTEGLISRRREGNHLIYSLADGHVADLLQNALAHALELDSKPALTTDEGD
jgi:ArsR family transcriptional regulator